MENNLKIGQSFEVVEWIKSPFGSEINEYKGVYGLMDLYGNIWTKTHVSSSDRLVDFSDSNKTRTKPIGKLTITKVKLR